MTLASVQRVSAGWQFEREQERRSKEDIFFSSKWI